ncbi:MAG: ATP-binding cassette domain-containing protein [Pseudomonadales bacterium]|nr:ATP-binding cassette domain-containing protein [Pseudomonadales bacterium]
MTEIHTPNANAVEFHRVSKSFGALTVFEDLSLTLPKDQITAIVGTSGSGKTTLLQMINGLERPDQGDVEVLGRSVPYENIESFRRGIGYAVQGAGLFPHMTAQQNVTLVAKLAGWSEEKRRSRFFDLLKTVGLEQDITSRLPRQLSGGQQQRLGICRALMLQPAILLLDEPFSAVDPITRLGLYESFEQARQTYPSTTVLVTHDLREARRLADFMVILDAGEVVQSGPPQAVLAQPATPYAERLIESQLA